MTANLTVHPRAATGSRASRKLRSQGLVPACLTGQDFTTVNLAIERREFMTARRHHEHVFELKLGAGVETVMVRELEWDAMGDDLVHVDFRRVIRGQETEAEVQLVFVGTPKGGLLNYLHAHIKVRAEPTLIPELIEIKVGQLELGQSLAARDIALPAGVKLAVAAETVIARIVAPKEEKVATPEPGAEVAAEAVAAAAVPAAAAKGAGAGPAGGKAAEAAPKAEAKKSEGKK